MKICFQTKAWGEGAGWFAQELATGMAKAGGEIIYVAPYAVPAEREPQHSRITRHVSHRERQSGSKIARVLSSLRRVMDGYIGCLKARSSTRTYLFSISDPLPFFIPLQLALAGLGARQFLIVHDAVPHSWVGLKKVPRLQWLGLWTSYRLATHLIATTRDCRDLLHARFGVPHRRISVLPLGAFDIGTPTDLPGQGNLLIFGSLRRNKRVLESIQAVQLCRQRGAPVTLTIAGGLDRADPPYWRECETQIATAPDGITSEIGFVPDERIPELIGQCDAVLLPYRDFSSASAVAILMATSQRPLIATSTGGIRDLFELGMSGIPLAENADVEAIADAIGAFFGRPISEWNVEAAASRDILLRELSWTTIGHRCIEIMRPDGPTNSSRPRSKNSS